MVYKDAGGLADLRQILDCFSWQSGVVVQAYNPSTQEGAEAGDCYKSEVSEAALD